MYIYIYIHANLYIVYNIQYNTILHVADPRSSTFGAESRQLFLCKVRAPQPPAIRFNTFQLDV